MCEDSFDFEWTSRRFRNPIPNHDPWSSSRTMLDPDEIIEAAESMEAEVEVALESSVLSC